MISNDDDITNYEASGEVLRVLYQVQDLGDRKRRWYGVSRLDRSEEWHGVSFRPDECGLYVGFIGELTGGPTYTGPVPDLDNPDAWLTALEEAERAAKEKEAGHAAQYQRGEREGFSADVMERIAVARAEAGVRADNYRFILNELSPIATEETGQTAD